MRDLYHCVNCGAKLNSNADYCSVCGTHVPIKQENHCLNPRCSRHISGYNFSIEIFYCDICGNPTTIGKETEHFC